MTYQGKRMAGTLINQAKKYGFRAQPRSGEDDFDPIDDETDKGSTVEVFAPPELSDQAITLDFVNEHREDLRYTKKWGVWHRFDGNVWREDETSSVIADVGDVCIRIADKAQRSNDPRKQHYARTAASKRTTEAVEWFARADRALAATTDQWDRDSWLLNTTGGVVNLRNGEMRDARADDHMTKITSVAPGGACPRWLAFLEQITAGDDALQRYLQRVAGYCLTGVTSEQALFFAYGTGGNGKGVFLNTLHWILNDYAANAPMGTFTVSRREQHPTELAMLDGPRFVIASETEQGERWAEARIKNLTGGDSITARKMAKDFYTFNPKLKLFFMGNHRPAISNIDPAMQRRMHLIPFTVSIAKEEQDQQLPEKLKAEAPGILGWMIEGCMAWQRDGLAPPAAVTRATKEYFDDEDTVAQWIAERCEQGAEHTSRTADLLASFASFATVSPDHKRQKWLTQTLKNRGFEAISMPKTRCSGLRGLRLKDTNNEDDDFC